jgi:hypothetical protein
MPATTYAAVRYMGDVTRAESELRIVYQQALELIETVVEDGAE